MPPSTLRFRKDIANHPPYDKCKAVFRAQYGAICPYIDIPVFKPRTARSDGSQGHNAPSGGRRRANHMSHPSDIEDWSIAELLERRPELVGFILRKKLDCVGCSFGAFCRLSDVSAAYGIDHEQLVDEFSQAMQRTNLNGLNSHWKGE